jgi:hypothetical protein
MPYLPAFSEIVAQSFLSVATYSNDQKIEDGEPLKEPAAEYFWFRFVLNYRRRL